MAFDRNDVENEKMKIRLEKNIKLDGMNPAERLKLDELLEGEAKNRLVNEDAKQALLDAARATGV